MGFVDRYRGLPGGGQHPGGFSDVGEATFAVSEEQPILHWDEARALIVDHPQIQVAVEVDVYKGRARGAGDHASEAGGAVARAQGEGAVPLVEHHVGAVGVLVRWVGPRVADGVDVAVVVDVAEDHQAGRSTFTGGSSSAG